MTYKLLDVHDEIADEAPGLNLISKKEKSSSSLTKKRFRKKSDADKTRGDDEVI
jgi:hypothetical protein